MLPMERLRVQELNGKWYVQAKVISFSTGKWNWITFDETPFHSKKEAEGMLPHFVV